MHIIYYILFCRKIYWCEPLLPSFFRLLILEYLYGAVPNLAELLLKKGLHRVADEKLHLFDTWFDRNGAVLLHERFISDQITTFSDLLAGEVPG